MAKWITRKDFMKMLGAAGIGYFVGNMVDDLAEKANETSQPAKPDKDSRGFIHAKEDFGVSGNGLFDDTAKLQAAFNEAAQSGLMLYVPKGTYKHTSPLFADGNDFRMFGDGTQTVFKPTYSNADAIVIGNRSNTSMRGSGSKPSGWAKDFAVIGPAPKPNTKSTGIKLNGMRQFRVENTYVSNFDIGYDLINNCFGSSFHNIRALWAGLNVGVNLRTGLQSGNDIQFYNAWLGGEIAAVHISGDGGGYQFWGGQFGNAEKAANSKVPDDQRGVVILGKDYHTNKLGGVANVTVEGVDIENFKYGWAFRAFYEVDLSLRGLGVYANDTKNFPRGFLKMDNAGASNISMLRVPVKGKYAGSRLIEVNGQQSGFCINEIECKYAVTLGGKMQNGGSMLVQSRIQQGQAMYRDDGTSKLLLDNVMLRPRGGRLELSADWGKTWKEIATK
ncbi:glycoside hydrolase family 55 protein [Paenibacillus sp. N4]|uniref:glycoside hydrolase family 55 protein n=1 Tax=Paenibacillus vietnamensis TaxID=2590547 RepID=UPI001CD17059|nr:glycoside hydrolase family 55 protein [Paenibacillus vietnamensis]MCA0755708.1 glycoside hydrolase family 55 protein [Paenibacillus vietnamensis]